MWSFLRWKRPPPPPSAAPAAKSSKPPFSSQQYWRERYASDRNSGAGSYGRLAEYKAEVVNGIVRERDVKSVVELGVGDGNQASLLDIPVYAGIDVVPLVVERARMRFADRAGWTFHEAGTLRPADKRFDMSMSLDVIYHLIEDEVFDAYMRDLTRFADRFMLIYASDHDADASAKHVRHRAYSRWLADHAPEWRLLTRYEHPYPMTDDSDPDQTSFAFFQLFERGAAVPAGT